MFCRTEYMCLCGNEKVNIQTSNGECKEISLEELYILEQNNLVH